MAQAAVSAGAPSIILPRSRPKELYLIVKTLEMELWEEVPDEARQME